VSMGVRYDTSWAAKFRGRSPLVTSAASTCDSRKRVLLFGNFVPLPMSGEPAPKRSELVVLSSIAAVLCFALRAPPTEASYAPCEPLHLEVSGLRRVSPGVVDELLLRKLPACLTPQELGEFERRLWALGIFDSVEVQRRDDVIAVNVREMDAHPGCRSLHWATLVGQLRAPQRRGGQSLRPSADLICLRRLRDWQAATEEILRVTMGD
jgi:hypothetical protein